MLLKTRFKNKLFITITLNSHVSTKQRIHMVHKLFKILTGKTHKTMYLIKKSDSSSRILYDKIGLLLLVLSKLLFYYK